jgi:hypothetical protein
MENQYKMKKIGTREEVFKGLANRTAGGLFKDDIIEKQFGNKILYISRKLSDKMRENFNTIRVNNPNFLKPRQQKRTMISQHVFNNPHLSEPITSQKTEPITSQKTEPITSQKTEPITSQQTVPITSQQIKKKVFANNTTGKTQKLLFRVKENTVKNIYYPELRGLNIQELKDEIAREEAEEDLGLRPQTNKLLSPFTIDDMPDIDLQTL